MEAEEVVTRLRALGSEENRAGMARYGINAEQALGVSIPHLRTLAREIGRDHELALDLWRTGIHEARLLASFIADPRRLTEEEADAWAADFDSWDIVDQCCSNLLDRTRFARKKIIEWARREEEFVRRAGFVLIACLAVHDKRAPDGEFLDWLPLIEEYSGDGRNFVKKAVNWALRHIGKRNQALNRAALAVAERLAASSDRTARWIGKDAARELTDPKVLARIKG